MKHTLLPALLLLSLAAQANKFYLDPASGNLSNPGTLSAPWSTLEAVIGAGYIVSNQYSPLPYNASTSSLIPKNASGFVHEGDTLVLMHGLHGAAFLNNYINTLPITIMGMAGHTPVIEYVHLRACKNWRFEHVKVSTEDFGYYLSGKLFYIESHSWQGPSSHIEIDNCELYSTQTPWTTAADWNNLMSDGIYIKGDSVVLKNNLVRNVNFGIQAVGNYIEAEHNQVINFAGDGMRMIGSHIAFRYNLIKNCYDVNDNHDDGIQSWAQINGVIADDNEVVGNIILNTDDTERPLNGPLQGIGCFDGFYNRWKVMNNLIMVDHWHGITFLGAHDCEIINNTVLDLTPDITPGGSWIRINAHKDGTPSSGCLVANNVANSFYVDGQTFNNKVLNTYQQYEDNFVDYAQYDFHLLPGSVLIDAANPVYSPSDDIELNPRPFGILPDIGAYEYTMVISGINQVDKDGGFKLYPNPSNSQLYIAGTEHICQLVMHDMHGRQIFTESYSENNGMIAISLEPYESGIYILSIMPCNSHGIMKTLKVIKP
ncbi:MAG: right-handed parallel beta-helix repeat-containing protein [Lewinellaceae bacterium]|nr:right-handed parallel beta-helix repeat-containing protein [Saprospiraceae bacterium]MCB9344737.1 right-handed parallel beta-helix repeat-containing protein [Lewinellaceae bacterium]